MRLGTRIVLAFLAVATVFGAAGVVCIAELRAVRARSEEFTQRLWPTADAVMETRITVAKVSRAVAAPPADQPTAATVADCRARLEETAAEIGRSALPAGRRGEITGLLASMARNLEQPILRHAAPGERMEAADAVAGPLIERLRTLGKTDAVAAAWTSVMAFNDFLITGDSAEESAFAAGIADLGRDPDFADFAAAHGALEAAGRAVFIAARDLNEARAVYAREHADLDELLSVVEAEFESDAVDPTAADITRKTARMVTLLATSITAAAACAMLLGWLLTRWIVARLTRAAAQLSAGSDQVTVAAEQISQGSQELACGASEQAAGIQQSSAAMTEISTRSGGNADRAAETHGLVVKLLGSVEGTTAAMREMTETMAGVHDASSEVAGIIKTIEEIAFQTNLLALNAAVEAARAGDAGKGFAVVAEEVRSLAQRSADAAGSTVRLIQTNLEQVRRGSEVVDRADQAIAAIRAAAGPVAENIDIIDRLTREQSESIDQVTQAIGSIGQTTQQVAATAEEAAASSEELSAQAQQMRGVVGEIVRIVHGRAAVPA